LLRFAGCESIFCGLQILILSSVGLQIRRNGKQKQYNAHLRLLRGIAAAQRHPAPVRGENDRIKQ
jgi:hypothetical protein